VQSEGADEQSSAPFFLAKHKRLLWGTLGCGAQAGGVIPQAVQELCSAKSEGGDVKQSPGSARHHPGGAEGVHSMENVEGED
jgi:hypothetical protein